MVRSSRHRVRRRLRAGAYLLPSLFTVGNILLGFLAILRGLAGDFQVATFLIFAAAALDALDGRIARLSGTESDFGREFDSLADVLTFGAAPALLAVMWGLGDLGRPGWLVPVGYLVCATTRLARFNVQTRSTDSRFFVGLPAPAAAGAAASTLLFFSGDGTSRWTQVLVLVVVGGLGLLMVSTFRYRSFKEVDLKKRRSYRLALPIAALLLVIGFDPPVFFLSAAVIYTLAPPLSWLVRRLRHQPLPPPEPAPRHEGT